MATGNRHGRLSSWTIGVVVAALFLVGFVATIVVLTVRHEAHERERQNHEQSIAGCERGNDLRKDINALGEAGDERFDQLIEAFRAVPIDPTRTSPEVARAFFDSVDRANTKYEAAVSKIKPIDCPKVYPKP